MRRKAVCLLTAFCLAAVLTGCSRTGREETAPVATLSPAIVSWEAPDGDRVVRQPGDYLLYVPEQKEQKLVVHNVHLEEADLLDTAEALIRKLLEEINGNRSLGLQRDLEIFREIPVEISRGICTVNLSSSALQLSYSDYYRLSLAISTTLCNLEEIRTVNVLTAGQSVAMDSAGRLPMGSLAGHADGPGNCLRKPADFVQWADHQPAVFRAAGFPERKREKPPVFRRRAGSLGIHGA